MKKQNLFSEDLIKQARDQLKALNKAFRKKSFAKSANSFARDRANEFLRSIGKRTFNTRRLSPSQKYLLGQSANAFLKMKGSTIEGAIDIRSKQQQSFYQRLKDRGGFIPENFSRYEKILEMYTPEDLRIYFGYEDPSNFIDTIVEIGNLNNTDYNSVIKFSKTKDKYSGNNIIKVENHDIIYTYELDDRIKIKKVKERLSSNDYDSMESTDDDQIGY